MKKGYKAIAVTLSMVLALTGVVGGAPMKGEAKAKIKLGNGKKNFANRYSQRPGKQFIPVGPGIGAKYYFPVWNRADCGQCGGE